MMPRCCVPSSIERSRSMKRQLPWRMWSRAAPRERSSSPCKHQVRPDMKTQYFTATSLDGFIATEDDSLDWLFPLGDINDTSYPGFFAQVGALAMGSSTYEWILRHAQKVGGETGPSWPYSQPTWVFSRRKLDAIAGADVRFVQGDVRGPHAEMVRAAGAKNIWVVGGGDLAGQFFDAHL